ncbi:MAG: OmpH/Skp family outer membrane protein [Planctomycetota bacterium]|jgi:Skp family chaperone for outer membrane proteins
MKASTVALGCLIGVVVLGMGYEGPQTPFVAFGNPEYSQAQSGAATPSSKIGVVNVKRVFQSCRRSARYNAEVLAEQSRTNAEIQRLSKEVEASKAGLNAFKRGSSDYLAQLREVYDKQGKHDAEQEYLMQQKALKYQRWVEDLYVDILRGTGEVAKQKGLDLVVEKDEVEFPALSVDNAMLAIRTHKVLYNGGCLDITDEVIAWLDEGE